MKVTPLIAALSKAAPSDETPSKAKLSKTTLLRVPPATTAPSEETPSVEETPAEETPAEETPSAEEAPTEETPSEETPSAEEAALAKVPSIKVDVPSLMKCNVRRAQGFCICTENGYPCCLFFFFLKEFKKNIFVCVFISKKYSTLHFIHYYPCA